MSKLAGSKESFAIEIDISKREPDLMGKVYVWIANTRLGAPEEENLILPHLYSMRLLVQRIENLSNKDLDSLSTEEVFNRVYCGSDQDYKHHVALGEAFDDFYLIAYKTDQDIVLCAKLNEEPFYEYKDFPSSPLRKAVPFAEFTRTIDQALKTG